MGIKQTLFSVVYPGGMTFHCFQLSYPLFFGTDMFIEDDPHKPSWNAGSDWHVMGRALSGQVSKFSRMTLAGDHTRIFDGVW
jgi:hypothetical protein